MLIIPVIVEWIKKNREEGQTAADYVRKQQEDKLATYKAMLDSGQKLTKLSRARMSLATELLKRVRDVPKSTS